MEARKGGASGGALRGATAGPMGGGLVVELAVAMACTGLLTAGVLVLVVDGARTFHARHRAIEAVALTEGGADAVIAALESAGAGLEGARVVTLQGERIGIVEVASGTLRVVVPMGEAREAEPAPGGELRLGDVAGLEDGDLVAGVGLVEPDTGEPPGALPLGRVARIVRDRPRGPSGGTVRVAWPAAEAALLERTGEPRALLPVALREFALLTLPDGLQLRRRDLGGRWQPVVDWLDEARFAVPVPGVVEVRFRAALPDAPARTARRRVRVR